MAAWVSHLAGAGSGHKVQSSREDYASSAQEMLER